MVEKNINKYNYNELLNELSDLCGILPEYWDISGKKHIVSIDTKKAILKTMNIQVESEDKVAKEIYKKKWKSWLNFVEPAYVISVNAQPINIPVCLPLSAKKEAALVISWSIKDEEGGKKSFILRSSEFDIVETQWINGKRYIKINLSFKEHLKIGYYDVDIQCKHTEKIFSCQKSSIKGKSRLIITPDACYIPEYLQNSRRWGLSINLYAVRSEYNWGIGDFSDLKEIVKWVAGLKGDFIGINPLHAITNTKPFGFSPYLPISRLYKNFIYLDIEKIPELNQLEYRDIVNSRKLDELRNSSLIDYEKVADVKEQVLRTAFEVFYKKHYKKNTSKGYEFKKYILDEGEELEHFAIYMVLASKLKKINWQEWQAKYRINSSPAVQSFKKTHRKEILFYQYIQWLIERQLRAVSIEAKKFKMQIGLYHDLAIGSSSGGSDTWNYQEVIANEANAGAPPDDFSPDGQNWGFPPLIPEKLKETGYKLFIQTLRKNMKYGGAIRIDHALGLFRLFWIPYGIKPKDGAYVSYPSEDLCRIIALESVRNKTIVIAEDLGTIGENVRETLKRFKMMSYRLFYFERNYPDPSFLPPDKYPEMAVCALTTHDLPTITGYWKARDLEVKKKIGQFKDENKYKEKITERERDRKLIIEALKSKGFISADYADKDIIPEMNTELCLAIYRYLASTPCKLILVSLDDIIGTVDQQNMPGTIDSYPNWIQKIPLSLKMLISDKRFNDLSDMFRQTLQSKI